MRATAVDLHGAPGRAGKAVAPRPRAKLVALSACALLMLPGPVAGWAAAASGGPEAGTDGSTPCPETAIRVPPGTDIAALVRASPEGETFCLGAGVHRLQSITPRDRQAFFGEAGAVLSGARLVEGFTRAGRLWVAGNQTQRGARRPDVPCVAGRPRCGFPEAVFLDDEPLVAAASLAEMEEGRFYIDYDSARLYLASDPRTRRVEASASAFAFGGHARDVRIEGLVVEKYATPVQSGAIGANAAAAGWIVHANEVRLNATIGVVVGSGSRVARNLIRGNGNMGAACVGTDILIEDNVIASNGYFSGVDTGWEGGGMKCAKTDRLVVQGNHVSANNGYGLWTDIDNIRALYARNRVEWNLFAGINHEISDAAVIRDNILVGNGEGFHVWLWGGAIQIQNSRNVEVTGNQVVTHRGNGICLIQQDRGSGSSGPYKTAGNRVHGNRIIGLVRNHGGTGAVADDDIAGMKAAGNVFDSNSYEGLDPAARHWGWVDGFYPWNEYRAASGQDASSTVRPSTDWRDAGGAPSARREDRR